MRYDKRKFNAYQNTGVDGADFRVRGSNIEDSQIRISHRRNNSYRGNKFQAIKNILTNKWFLIIGLPIILIIILYALIWLSYGKTAADISLYFIIIFIVVILMVIFLPRRKTYDPIREGIYHEELIRQQARDDFNNNRRRRW